MTDSLWEALAGRAPGQPVGPAEPGLYDAVIERLNPARARPRLRPGIEDAALVSLRGSPYVMLRSPDPQPAYLRLDPAEVELARRMDGSRTVASLVADLAKLTGELAPARVVRIVADLAANRMLEELPVDAFRPLRRVRRRSPLRRAGAAILEVLRGRRFALFGVDPVVGFLYRAGGRLLFTRVGAAVVATVAVVGAVAFGVRWVQGTETVFSVGDSVVLGAVVLLLLNAVCLVAHELGHALAAKHAGRRVPSAGVLLYFGIPSVFVDTSDVWMAGRRARLLTSASGPLAAVFLAGALNLAAVAVPELGPAAVKLGFLWYLNVVFNLNPLLALDGYYLLMDWLELPGLRARGLALTIARLRRRRLGWGGLLGDERLYAMYGTIAMLWLVVTLGLGVRLWRDRLDSLGATLWSDGLGGGAGFILILLLLLAPLLGTILGRIGAAVGSWRRARRITPVAALEAKIAALRRSLLVSLAPERLRALAEGSTWLRLPVGARLADGTSAVVADGSVDGWSDSGGRRRVVRRALPGDLVAAGAGGDAAVAWRSGGARLLAFPSGFDPEPILAAGDDTERIVAAAAALAAMDAAGTGRETGVHPALHGTPVVGPGGFVATADTDDGRLDAIDRRTRRLVLALIVVALLAILVAVPDGSAWSEVPGDRVRVDLERGTATAVGRAASTALVAPASIVIRRGWTVELGEASLARLTFRGGATAVLCARTRLVLESAATEGSGPVRPVARLALAAGAMLADTASASSGFRPLAVTIDAGPLVEAAGAASFAVRRGAVAVGAGAVTVDGTRVVNGGGSVACPPGGLGPDPGATPAPGSTASPGPPTAGPTASGATGTPPVTVPPVPSATASETAGPTATPVSTPPPTPVVTPPPPTRPPTPRPTATPQPTPAPTPAPEFTIKCTNTTLPDPMSSWGSTCTITSVNGFSAPVGLDCAFATPQSSAMIKCSFTAPSPVVPPNDSVTVTVSITVTPPDCYPFDVIATAGSLAHRVRFSCP